MKKKDLKPAGVFHFFEEICQIPRPSKHEEKMIEYLVNFGKQYNLKTSVDKTGNVVIAKAATKGYENLKPIILQSHMDMVCDKLSTVEHDFFKDPIQTHIDGEWLRTNGTTMGADDGIGDATQLAILADDTIEHGPLECLFTRDEETGLTGAFGIEEGFIHGEILLNLDSEEEGLLYIGCAGGVDSVGDFTYSEIDIPKDYYFCRIDVNGLIGGHSGGDIHLGRANANKILGRFLSASLTKYDMYLCEIDGGKLRNAIPAYAHAVVAIPEEDKHNLRADLNIFETIVQSEFQVSDPNLAMQMETASPYPKAIDRKTTKQILQTLYAIPHGVFAMSQEVPGLVETSTNMASIKMNDGHIIFNTSQRSSIDSCKENIATMVRTVLEMGGATVSHSDGYPGWKPNIHSPILEIAVNSYKRLFNVDPQVLAIHAGLECGLFLKKYPSLDMISFGPSLLNVHTPTECLHIPSVERFWKHLIDILVHIPAKSC